MDTLERDDFVYALTQTLAFYNKELDKMQTSFWVTACSDRSVRKLKAALIEYTRIGKFAPKPADILSIVDTMQQTVHKELPPPPTTNCPPEVAKAWLWYNRMNCAGTNLEGIFGKGERPDPETEDRYIHIVNHEAHKYGTPEAILPEHRLREVWG